MFQVSFLTYHDYAQTLLQDIYNARKKEIDNEIKKEIEESQGPKVPWNWPRLSQVNHLLNQTIAEDYAKWIISRMRLRIQKWMS
jgi:hypothetical protein